MWHESAEEKYRNWWVNLNETDQLAEIDIDGRLRWFLK
jgi:hypothetical protein